MSDDPLDVKTYRKPVKIRCPGCGSIEDAVVVYKDGWPWPEYVHNCRACDYWIIESEWEEIDDQNEDQRRSHSASL